MSKIVDERLAARQWYDSAIWGSEDFVEACCRAWVEGRAALQAEVERMEAEREQLAKERQGFKDVAEHLQRTEAAHQRELAQVKADLKSCQAKNRAMLAENEDHIQQLRKEQLSVQTLRDQRDALREALVGLMEYAGIIEERCDCVATDKARAALGGKQ